MSSWNSVADTTVSTITTDIRSAGGRGTAGQSGDRPRTTGFKGNTPEMNGSVFECYDEQGDRRQYIKTAVEALESHAKKTFKYSEDLLAPLFATESRLPVLATPPKPTKTTDGKEPDEADIELWREEIKELAKRKRALQSNLSTIQASIWGQCSEAMRARIKKSLAEYEAKTAKDDCKWFLSNIQAITMQFDERRHGYTSMLNAMAGFLNCRQQPKQSVTNYMEALKSHIHTVEYHGGTLVLNIDLAPETAMDWRKLSEAEQLSTNSCCPTFTDIYFILDRFCLLVRDRVDILDPPTGSRRLLGIVDRCCLKQNCIIQFQNLKLYI